jgi:transposase
MPWKDCGPMDEKMKFVARLLEGESMAAVCREFGISRKTGYKIFDRYREYGVEGLCDRSRRPYKQANQLAVQTVAAIVGLKKQKPHWGAPKIRELFKRKHPTIALPATSTVHAILDRHGLIEKKSRRRKYKAKGTHLSIPDAPNDLWCADFKGQFLTGDKKYCYPLTITDQVSRFLLCCEGLESVKENWRCQLTNTSKTS